MDILFILIKSIFLLNLFFKMFNLETMCWWRLYASEIWSNRQQWTLLDFYNCDYRDWMSLYSELGLVSNGIHFPFFLIVQWRWLKSGKWKIRWISGISESKDQCIWMWKRWLSIWAWIIWKMNILFVIYCNNILVGYLWHFEIWNTSIRRALVFSKAAQHTRVRWWWPCWIPLVLGQ